MSSEIEVAHDSTSKLNWQQLVAQKRSECLRKTQQEWTLTEDYKKSLNVGTAENTNLFQLDVPRNCGILTEKELDITENYSAVKLIEQLATKKLSALEVTTAFCKRAAIAQQLLSCLTEVQYSEALKRARDLDAYYEHEGKVVGPLHGLPISVKDSFCLKGLQSTVGYCSLLQSQPAQHNSALMQMLLDMGAVLYVKTNIPQTMMTGDSENNIFGRTLNPHNTSLTAGGSSGGEGSLVSFRGSVLGVGTDIAGSIRIPALCCGVYGFKPTADRVPFGGQVSGGMEGLPGPMPSAGPLAHSLDDIELFLSTIINGRPSNYDSSAFAAPWQPSPFKESPKLRIGVLPEEKVFPLQPPIRRTLQDAIAALKKAGHEVFTMTRNEDRSVSLGNRLTFAYYILGPDPSGDHFGPNGEPMVKSVAARSNPMFAGPLPIDFSQDPFHKIDALHEVRKSYSEAWRKYWIANKIDVVLAPAAQNTATPLDTFIWPPYTQVWNILDYPACVIPYGKVSKADDPTPDPNDDFGPQPNYTPDVMDGAPCAVQIVTRRFEDEKCLAAAKIIDQVLKGSQ